MANNSIKVSDQLELSSDLEGKVVLITGASSGLGWDFTINLADTGCKVIPAAHEWIDLNPFATSSMDPAPLILMLPCLSSSISRLTLQSLKQLYEKLGQLLAILMF